MKTGLKDIINLDYLVSQDDKLDSQQDIEALTQRDRRIYQQCKKNAAPKILLMSWLKFREKEITENPEESTLLPGNIFSRLYQWMVWTVILSGSITGISLAISFLAYHGTRPINTTVFIAIFIVFQFFLILLTLVLLAKKKIGSNQKGLLSSLFFNLLPQILEKREWGTDGAGLRTFFKKSREALSYTAALIRMKDREYADLFFWPFFILTSLFAFSFASGALGGTLFRVLVSDMAFGWQSTLPATSSGIHELVSFIALPWSWLVPESMAHPDLMQIEGSRIVLKDGIQVLATRDLISWWPFLCLGILFYAVIPRGILIASGLFAQKKSLERFDFDRPGYQLLIARMQSRILDIDVHETPASHAIRENSIKGMANVPSFPSPPDGPFKKSVLLVSKSVYTGDAVATLISYIGRNLFSKVNETIGIRFDEKKDEGVMNRLGEQDADQVVLVHEVWQPPIRGLLFYITKLKAAMDPDQTLIILLTGTAEEKDLGVAGADTDYEVWKKAVFKLEDPQIIVKRFL